MLALFPVLVGVTVLVFAIMQLAPGDPALIMLGPRATAESLQQIREELGLNLPLHVQYLRWLGKVATGDWGRSIQLRREVLPLLVQRFQATALLAVGATLLAVLVGVPVGIVSSTRQYSLLDRCSMVGALVGFSLPVFWLGIVLQILFGLYLKILPVSGMYSPGSQSLGEALVHAVLPCLALATGPGAVVARMTRSSMLEVIRQDFIRTARAKGVGERAVIYRHALRNALIPVVTVVGMQVGYLLGGEILVETVFSWPGLGLLMVNGILARDFPLVQGAILVIATCYVVVNLVVDLTYALLDPRIQYR
jgi:peptide/nickel transport system permease protein